jgi:uncharacterized protein (TIGR03067 family)
MFDTKCARLAAVALLCLCSPALGEDKKDAAKLNGKWEIISHEVEGKLTPKDEWQFLAWEIDGSKLAILTKGFGGAPDRVLNFDLKAADGKIDIKSKNPESALCGIYKREGESLIVALNSGSDLRPLKFETAGLEGAGFMLTLKPKK